MTESTESTEARITVYPDGPLIVRGDFVVELLDEGPLPKQPTMALCRCGRSATKPLCDGSHKKRARQTEPVDRDRDSDSD